MVPRAQLRAAATADVTQSLQAFCQQVAGASPDFDELMMVGLLLQENRASVPRRSWTGLLQRSRHCVWILLARSYTVFGVPIPAYLPLQSRSLRDWRRFVLSSALNPM